MHLFSHSPMLSALLHSVGASRRGLAVLTLAGSDAPDNAGRPDDGPLCTVYRADTRGPDVISREGFQPRGTGIEISKLIEHNQRNRPSGAVSASWSFTAAQRVLFELGRGDEPIYLYKIYLPRRLAIDVNRTLGSIALVPHQMEVLMIGGARPEWINYIGQVLPHHLKRPTSFQMRLYELIAAYHDDPLIEHLRGLHPHGPHVA
jgi:hypothetical protein